MDTMLTTDFAISFIGGAVITSLLIQMVKNAFDNIIAGKRTRDLIVFVEMVGCAALVAFIWQRSSTIHGLEDQLTFGVRWLFYLCGSTLIYKWFTKKIAPDILRRTPVNPE